jgi:ATP-dependent helicase YprA (DUF1998 family)
MTNPEMIHLSILPHHDRWGDLLGRLQFVVVDEVHTYRGILGSHMAQVFRRLRRMCRHYGTSPTFVFTSATVANPDELAGQLTGLPVETVRQSTAGTGRRHLILMEPVDGPLAATLTLLKAALNRGFAPSFTRNRANWPNCWRSGRKTDPDRLPIVSVPIGPAFCPKSAVRLKPNWPPGNCWP